MLHRSRTFILSTLLHQHHRPHLYVENNHRQCNSRCVQGRKFSLAENESIYIYIYIYISDRIPPKSVQSYSVNRPAFSLVAGSATELKDHVDGGAGGNIVGVEGLVVGTEREEWRDARRGLLISKTTQIEKPKWRFRTFIDDK